MKNSPGHSLLSVHILIGFCLLLMVLHTHAQQSNAQPTIASLTAERDQAMEKVRAIVNQPVTRYAPRPGIPVSVYKPGWFHEGANKPDFNNVDVRTTQEMNYDSKGYVTSDLNPGVIFLGRQLEFNANTKYFYTDRTLPKKKLTEAEMLEINRLYRIIGRCERELNKQHNLEPVIITQTITETVTIETNAEPQPKPFFQRIPRSNYINGGIAIGSILLLYCGYKIVKK